MKPALGRSRGGRRTKRHATVDALGNPTGLHLTGGEAHDLAGADALLPGVAAAASIADRGDDAEGRVLAVPREAGTVAIIPSKRHRTVPRDDDRHRYGARYLVEHSFDRLKRYRASATRHDKTKRNFLAAVHLAATVSLLNRRHAVVLRHREARPSRARLRGEVAASPHVRGNPS
jgi:transposase